MTKTNINENHTKQQGDKMSILTPITRLALLGAAAGMIYMAGITVIKNREPPTIEPGYTNPAHVELYKPKNENGNTEFYLTYENGTDKLSLPIKEGPQGPIVGNSEYLWSSMSEETQTRYITEGWGGLQTEIKSTLVQENWQDIQLETRKEILRTSLDRIIENYAEKQNE